MMKFKIISVFLFVFSISCFSQTKNEKESRIRLDAFPEASKLVITPILSKVKRIRYYRETDGNRSSFESKFKYHKYWYSIEFDNNGILEDIEVTVKEKQLDTSIRLKLNAYLKRRFKTYNYLKIQEQYVSPKTFDDINYLTHILEHRNTIPSNYEIVVAVETHDNWEIREMTFNYLGKFLNERTIKQDSYEYIMY